MLQAELDNASQTNDNASQTSEPSPQQISDATSVAAVKNWADATYIPPRGSKRTKEQKHLAIAAKVSQTIIQEMVAETYKAADRNNDAVCTVLSVLEVGEIADAVATNIRLLLGGEQHLLLTEFQGALPGMVKARTVGQAIASYLSPESKSAIVATAVATIGNSAGRIAEATAKKAA